jgi:hypothetical protein
MIGGKFKLVRVFHPPLSLLSFFYLLSLARSAPLPHAPSLPPPAFVWPPLVSKAGPHRLRRLLFILNRVDFILTSFID